MPAARREIQRSQYVDEERQRMQYEVTCRGSICEYGDGRSLVEVVCCTGCLVKSTIAPEMEGTADPFASRKPSLKQLSTANALSGKISKPRDAVVRTVRLVGKFFDTNIAPHKATSPHLKTMPYLATKHGP